MGYYCCLRVGLVLFVGIVCLWCGVILHFWFLFVDQNVQLKLVGEYNHLEKLTYDLLLCVCFMVMVCFHYVFFVCF